MSCLPFKMTLVLTCLRAVPTVMPSFCPNLQKSFGVICFYHRILADGIHNMDSTEECVPSSLLQFVGMVEHGADIKFQLIFGAPKTDLAMAQLLQYNCYARFKEGAPTHRHSKDQETPFPIYSGLSVFANTRKRKRVEMLHANGLSTSYDRVLGISAELGDAIVTKCIGYGVFYPPELCRGLFTTSAMDNIDHNPSSSTSTTSFHGTSISISQHPTHKNEGEKQEELQVRGTKVKRVAELPYKLSWFSLKFMILQKSTLLICRTTFWM